MFTFEHNYSSFEQLTTALAKKMGTQVKDGWLFFPPQYARGYFRSLSLPNGLEVLVVNMTNHVDWLFFRKKEKNEYYILRFHSISVPNHLEVKIGADTLERTNQQIEVVYLISSLFDWHYKAKAGTSVKAVDILIPKDWLGKLLGVELFENVLPSYIALKSRSFNMEPLDAYYQELMNEILQEDIDTQFPKLYVLNRVQLMMERFFNRIHTRVSLADVESKFKSEDIRTILELEKGMVADFTKKPPAITDLARQAAMSTTKFKNLFKSVFGLPVYEYYQQKRMQYAADLLAEEQLAVRQVGEQVGYNNVSNFSAAFKKQFNVPPQEYCKN